MASERSGRVMHGSDPRDRTDLRSPQGRTPPVDPAGVAQADQAEVPAVPPRHLARIRRAPTPGLARSVLSAGLLMAVVVALGAMVVLRAVHQPGQPGLRNGAGNAIAPRSSAASTTEPPSTTALALPQSALPAVGQPLLLDGGFERGLVFMHELPDTTCRRVPGGATGRWAMRVTADAKLAGPPGLWLDLTHAAVPGSRWGASVKVRGRPGLWAELRLYERKGRSVVADGQPMLLRDANWHTLAVSRGFAFPGSVLGVDVRLVDARPGQTFLIDDLQARRTA
jgi:hypothetical protein